MLKAARQKAKLTQAQLAQAAHCDQSVISKLEAGRVQEPAYRLVVRVCRVLGVDPETIAEFRVGRA